MRRTRPGRQKAPSAKRCIKTKLTTKTVDIDGLGQKAPSAKRCIKTARSGGTIAGARLSVRKHRAPKGALRLKYSPLHLTPSEIRQKAPSAKRCIKTQNDLSVDVLIHARQKAPSAKRCIKTGEGVGIWSPENTRQKAPSAKRCIKTRPLSTPAFTPPSVRKHRAPKGALRPKSDARKAAARERSESTERQKVH